MRVLATYHNDFGRMGSLNASLVLEKEHYDALLGETIYFGEALGKHSGVESNLTADNFKIGLTETPENSETFNLLDKLFPLGHSDAFYDRLRELYYA